jgi:hypothetical protein
MPLLNISTISGNNMVIQVGLAFLSGEKEKDYTGQLTIYSILWLNTRLIYFWFGNYDSRFGIWGYRKFELFLSRKWVQD